jgi:hypothetical protein
MPVSLTAPLLFMFMPVTTPITSLGRTTMTDNHVSTSVPVAISEKSYGKDFMRGFLIAAPACALFWGAGALVALTSLNIIHI